MSRFMYEGIVVCHTTHCPVQTINVIEGITNPDQFAESYGHPYEREDYCGVCGNPGVLEDIYEVGIC